jgi:hypothetical protein
MNRTSQRGKSCMTHQARTAPDYEYLWHINWKWKNKSENIPSRAHRILLDSLYVIQRAGSTHSRKNLQESTNGHMIIA